MARNVQLVFCLLGLTSFASGARIHLEESQVKNKKLQAEAGSNQSLTDNDLAKRCNKKFCEKNFEKFCDYDSETGKTFLKNDETAQKYCSGCGFTDGYVLGSFCSKRCNDVWCPKNFHDVCEYHDDATSGKETTFLKKEATIQLRCGSCGGMVHAFCGMKCNSAYCKRKDTKDKICKYDSTRKEFSIERVKFTKLECGGCSGLC